MKQILKGWSALLLALLSTTTFAKMVEDGSSFTGKYVASTSACAKSELDYQTGKTVLNFNFGFEGTPEGLRMDGRLMQIEDLQTFDHGGGIITGGSARYVSGEEFETDFVQINPSLNHGEKTKTNDVYLINGGDIVKTTTTIIGTQPGVSTSCTFLKTN